MDLNAPLGMTPPPPRRWRRALPIVAAAGVVVALCGAAYMIASADPHGGHPFVVVALPSPLPPPHPSLLDATPTGALTSSPVDARTALGRPDAIAAERGATEPGRPERGVLEGGVMVYRGSAEGGTSAAAAVRGPLVIDVTRALDDPMGKSRAASSAVAKSASPASAFSANAFSASTSSASASSAGSSSTPASASKPRIAIFVSGMGLDTNATRTATEIMPSAVALAFLPYGGTVADAVGAAKAREHEVLLQLPMRNEAGAPGPHALRPDAPAETTKSDLAWMMGRFQGYDGVVNLLGASATADSALMSIVLKTVGAHHLFYLDDGTSRRSVATSLATDLNVDAVQTDLVLDATSDPAVVRANLDRLVAIAKRKGHAIGMATGLPEHLAEISRFAADLAGKGITLVPVSALAHGDAPVASGATAQR